MQFAAGRPPLPQTSGVVPPGAPPERGDRRSSARRSDNFGIIPTSYDESVYMSSDEIRRLSLHGEAEAVTQKKPAPLERYDGYKLFGGRLENHLGQFMPPHISPGLNFDGFARPPYSPEEERRSQNRTADGHHHHHHDSPDEQQLEDSPEKSHRRHHRHHHHHHHHHAAARQDHESSPDEHGAPHSGQLHDVSGDAERNLRKKYEEAQHADHRTSDHHHHGTRHDRDSSPDDDLHAPNAKHHHDTSHHHHSNNPDDRHSHHSDHSKSRQLHTEQPPSSSSLHEREHNNERDRASSHSRHSQSQHSNSKHHHHRHSANRSREHLHADHPAAATAALNTTGERERDRTSSHSRRSHNSATEKSNNNNNREQSPNHLTPAQQQEYEELLSRVAALEQDNARLEHAATTAAAAAAAASAAAASAASAASAAGGSETQQAKGSEPELEQGQTTKIVRSLIQERDWLMKRLRALEEEKVRNRSSPAANPNSNPTPNANTSVNKSITKQSHTPDRTRGSSGDRHSEGSADSSVHFGSELGSSFNRTGGMTPDLTGPGKWNPFARNTRDNTNPPFVRVADDRFLQDVQINLSLADVFGSNELLAEQLPYVLQTCRRYYGLLLGLYHQYSSRFVHLMETSRTLYEMEMEEPHFTVFIRELKLGLSKGGTYRLFTKVRGHDNISPQSAKPGESHGNANRPHILLDEFIEAIIRLSVDFAKRSHATRRSRQNMTISSGLLPRHEDIDDSVYDADGSLVDVAEAITAFITKVVYPQTCDEAMDPVRVQLMHPQVKKSLLRMCTLLSQLHQRYASNVRAQCHYMTVEDMDMLLQDCKVYDQRMNPARLLAMFVRSCIDDYGRASEMELPQFIECVARIASVKNRDPRKAMEDKISDLVYNTLIPRGLRQCAWK
eukprot:gnl/Spiro4/14630_TR7877_c0_g1_i1.p1 gnl/Spiro4/14630_TR7877_c0_g1~~gnl/Spiro4/14630_TR7877_c0_g1_i1.p1  ORF type:complete len:922 (-),score=253.30 gnl/Spiro4/14630_TR7877_c0_g1_i1:97-2796(-)